MPVERVHLLQRHEVDVFLHELPGHEVTADVEVRSPPGKPGVVLDRHRGRHPGHVLHLRFPEKRRREQLPETLHSIENPGPLDRPDSDPPATRLQPVSLRAEPAQRSVAPKHDGVAGGGSAGSDGQAETGGGVEIVGQLIGQIAGEAVGPDGGTTGQGKLAGFGRNADRTGNDRDGRRVFRVGRGGHQDQSCKNHLCLSFSRVQEPPRPGAGTRGQTRGKSPLRRARGPARSPASRGGSPPPGAPAPPGPRRKRRSYSRDHW
jgi:hypothetical protein